ncbi:hypothetical protein PUNSTDRAFT_99350 [Punctularia strigosozonata HHB-11173 SS5]|uniref:uncharacterized protein n=1 Tax=Punctularia strigosozonata (strain HHB-11173) TaxID=741275 RepID=UPI0004416398|nr:uncharacterized protein PUNSTDRAFT_99350 [Punctularia strigosozonata HHB-11173 SS5]EIN11987.1 hypothetical protein PUNSTDRAFT_99350 [Punctularia strigosozonata HHB-11173 SS5]
MKNLTAWRSEAKLESSQSPKRSGTLHTLQEEAKRQKAAEALVKRASKVSASDRKAKESAYVVRSLIVGPTLSNMPRPSGATKAQVNKVKGQLLESRTANKVIAQLRALPIAEAPIATAGDHSSAKIGTATKGHGPIHAVCLPFTESEAAGKHFASAGYKAASSEGVVERALEDVPSIATATVETAVTMFQDLHIVDLLAAPNMGLGAPGDAPGILSGAIPTAETVINGITQITPQLMNLGYAMGKAVYVNHEGVYPPTDRMSILTYWWGLELVLPPPSIAFLSHAPSIAHAIINFLTAMSVANSGVREVLPFIRYISQYVDFEFGVIQKMDQGQGVVCAATWIMPAALVPRPWDFPPPPPPSASAQAPAEVDSGTQTDTSGAVPSSPPETAPSSSSPPGLPTSGATPQPPSIPVAQPLPNPGIPATVPTSSPSITVTTATLPRHAEPPVTA